MKAQRDGAVRWLVLALLALAVAGITGPMAHVLELHNKMALGGADWLTVQQVLYRGWGGVFGSIDIAAIIVGLVVAFLARTPAIRMSALIVAGVYMLMVADFFVFNAPANAAFNSWTAQTLPASWLATRVQWETGHAIAAALSLAALIAAMCGAYLCFAERSVSSRATIG